LTGIRKSLFEWQIIKCQTAAGSVLQDNKITAGQNKFNSGKKDSTHVKTRSTHSKTNSTLRKTIPTQTKQNNYSQQNKIKVGKTESITRQKKINLWQKKINQLDVSKQNKIRLWNKSNSQKQNQLMGKQNQHTKARQNKTDWRQSKISSQQNFVRYSTVLDIHL